MSKPIRKKRQVRKKRSDIIGKIITLHHFCDLHRRLPKIGEVHHRTKIGKMWRNFKYKNGYQEFSQMILHHPLCLHDYKFFILRKESQIFAKFFMSLPS